MVSAETPQMSKLIPPTQSQNSLLFDPFLSIYNIRHKSYNFIVACEINTEIFQINISLEFVKKWLSSYLCKEKFFRRVQIFTPSTRVEIPTQDWSISTVSKPKLFMFYFSSLFYQLNKWRSTIFLKFYHFVNGVFSCFEWY